LIISILPDFQIFQPFDKENNKIMFYHMAFIILSIYQVFSSKEKTVVTAK